MLDCSSLFNVSVLIMLLLYATIVVSLWFCLSDKSFDAERKIQVMQANIVELKETYLRIRSELTQWEKCRKKILEKKRKYLYFLLLLQSESFILSGKQERHAAKLAKKAALAAAENAKKQASVGEQSGVGSSNDVADKAATSSCIGKDSSEQQ